MDEEEKFGRRVILADGSAYEDATAGYADGILVLFMRKSVTMQQASAIFFDPAKTETIVFEYGDMADTYEGFTHVVNMNEDYDGNVTVSMKQNA